MRHFTTETYAERIAAAVRLVQLRGLAGLLLFKQESMYYLTGYDTTGYVSFQAMYLAADGRVALFTRSPELRGIPLTSVVTDVQIYIDDARRNPAEELREFVQARGGGGPLGIEYDAWGLTAKRCKQVEAAFLGFASLVDASDLVNSLRLVKSPAEIEFVRRAAALGRAAFDAVVAATEPGVQECELMGAMQASVFAGGGDFASGRWIVGCGPRALMVKHFGGHHGRVAADDRVQVEIAAAYVHYHAGWAHTLYVGRPDPAQIDLFRIAADALLASLEACRPGAPASGMFHAHAAVLDGAGHRAHRLNASGYSLGATYPPTWMDGLPLCAGNETLLQPGMVLFPQAFVFDDSRGHTAGIGRTVVVTATGYELLTAIPFEIVIK
jgi:Xaa-Pro dipeptidase